MDFDKSSATHQWVAAANHLFYVGLRYYKWHKGWWWVFSKQTGWRKSNNDRAWFKQEKAEGFFVKLTKEERGQLAKAD